MSRNCEIRIIVMILCAIALAYSRVVAQEEINYDVSFSANASSGVFAPYFIGSLNHGKTTQKNAVLLDAAVSKDIDDDDRFSWGFGIEAYGGASSRNDYMKWSAETEEWTYHPLGPSALTLQQVYVETKYRQVYIMAGMKEHCNALMNPDLSSGDFVESGNARPIPEVRIGFYDFVDIPFTNHWLQIQCQAAYGIMSDYGYLKNLYNYYNYHIAKNTIYNYKFCYFRTNPSQRFVATLGMQSGGFFGGSCDYYKKGVLQYTRKYRQDLKSFFDMLIPVLNTDENFAMGSTLGSWDFFGQYILDGGDEVCAYFQWPMEDGSGLARRNKLDGVWGIEYRRSTPGIVNGVVVEYIDFRDQSGPIHFAPGDFDSSTITSESTGRDNYYNNAFYNSYANYGMSIGTPFLMSPIYNLDGYPGFTANRANGFHIGIDGDFSTCLHYRIQLTHQRNFGSYDTPFVDMRTNTSSMVECRYNFSDAVELRGILAYDKGPLLGDNFGALVSVTYKSSFTK